METPYNKRDEWRIDMHRVDGTIYLNVVKLDEQVFRGQDRLMYYGYKFEELCTRGDGSASSVDANVEFCSVFKLKIGDSKVVLGAEIDCYDGEEGEGSEAPHSKYVEIKTSKAIEHGGQRKTFERKLLKYWIQSFLAGVPSSESVTRTRHTFQITSHARQGRCAQITHTIATSHWCSIA